MKVIPEIRSATIEKRLKIIDYIGKHIKITFS